MGNIVLLDDLTINKIAAGEVIERPASVVKELMENSIDAGATNITAEIKNGGITYIRITDDGKGILPDDIEIAFERHATSKIRNAKDLELVKSMGFRGEALASIAAIARVELTSRTADNDVGYRVVVEGGRIIEKGEVGCPKGTTIIVENLFFNTPVRYKFLKKDFTETGYVEDSVTRIALVNPNIAIKLINTNKTIIQTNGNGNLKDAVYAIYGKDIAENIVNVDYQFEDMKIKGCIGNSTIARSNRSNQLFFVNGRYVKDKTLTGAADQAFKGMITIGKYGFLILNIEIDSHKLDVNVHPAKLEVRFQEENKVFKLVYHAIKEALLQEDYLGISKNAFVNSDNSETNVDEDIVKIQPEETGNLVEDIYNAKLVEELYNSDKNSEHIESKQPEENIENDKHEDREGNKLIEKDEPSVENNSKINTEDEYDKAFEEMFKKTFGKMPITDKQIEDHKKQYAEEKQIEIKNADNISILEGKTVFNTLRYKFIGIVFSTYIIIEIDNEMYIIDQHAAHERILYEKIKSNYYSDEEKDSQLMLLPDIINLTHKEMAIAKENFDLFKKAGFELEEFGENTIKLSGVPNICIDLDTKELFLETIDEINTVARTAKQEIEEKFIATIACKAAVKAKMALKFEEVDSLMKQLLAIKNPFTCPHGRPTAIKLSQYEIEKKFSRK